MTSRNIDILIINIFAVLHAAVAVVCRLVGLTDELMLTLLSMLLVVIICLRRNMKMEFMAVSVILVNIFGFFLGKAGALLLGAVSSSPLVVNPISTLFTTLVIGWSVYLLTFSSERFRLKGEQTVERGLKWFLVAFVLIICIRLAIILMFSGSLDSENTVINFVVDYIFSCAVLIFLSEYAIRISNKARQDRETAHQAQYSYMRLKQQVNPHFLFNSLNILDCLVCEDKNEQASTYIHKLAGIYRYMIKNEDGTLVHLRDELTFVSLYVELLQVRFPEGLEVSVEIPEEMMSSYVVPCSVQLLIENATKHNSVSPDCPLKIRITAGNSQIIVANNINPKISTSPSTGLGLKYIREQYQDISGNGIEVETREGEYIVRLPLL